MRHSSLFLGEYTHKLPSFKNYQTKSCQYRISRLPARMSPRSACQQGDRAWSPSGELADRRTPTVYQALPHRAVGIVLQGGCPVSWRYTVTVLYSRYTVTKAGHMALSAADRQRLYREKIKRGELKRFQVRFAARNWDQGGLLVRCVTV